jgi:hypothetical protein
MKLLQLAVAVALIVCVIACGGTGSIPPASSNAAVPVGSDPQLVTMWDSAQQYVATNNIVLNAAAMVVHPGIPPDTLPPDQRALTTSDVGATVTTLPDLTVAQLQAENPGTTLQHNTDPTGIVHCPSNSEGAKYCASYVSGSAIYVAASLEYSDNATGYEMQNVILAKLGYDISKR